MKADAKVLAFVLAGGEGTRLYPLTAEHAKPAVPFAQGRRIVDFVLSNLTLSRIQPIYVLAQYQPRSLIEHVRCVWTNRSRGGDPVSVLLGQSDGAQTSFKGTADAVYQHLELVRRHRPDVVAVFAADHVYRMDIRQMVNFHERRNADVTVAAVPVPMKEASSFGILRAGLAGEVLEFQEKPERAVPMASDPARAYASMGNYLFSPRALIDLLDDARSRNGTDFGRHILPRLPGTSRVFAYDFSTNTVPGVKAHEERGYWRDVGTLQAYVAAQRDVCGPLPRFHLDNAQWPIQRDTHCLWDTPSFQHGIHQFGATPLQAQRSARNYDQGTPP